MNFSKLINILKLVIIATNEVNHRVEFFNEIYFVIAENTIDFIVRFATFLHCLRTVTVYNQTSNSLVRR